jgi:hypothetical protein
MTDRGGKTVAIIQSSYIPWRGFFAIIARADTFVFLDSVQFTRRDWRSRNRIKTPPGPLWLSIPVRQKGQYHAPIDAMEIADPGWASQHWRTIQANYRRAAGFRALADHLGGMYHAAAAEASLSVVNQLTIREIAALLGIRTRFTRDIDLLPRARLDAMDPTERLVALAEQAGAATYLSGPSARAYLNEAAFAERGMAVAWMDYTRLPAYPQLWGDFDPSLSVIDALLNLGPDGAREALGG